MRPLRTTAGLLVGVAAISAMAFVPGTASATEAPVGSCDSTLVQNADGSSLITNQVNGILDGELYDAGCVTVYSVPGSVLRFVDAVTYPGWSSRVKEDGAKKRKVSVTFENVAAGVRINYTIEPGRVDWRISSL